MRALSSSSFPSASQKELVPTKLAFAALSFPPHLWTPKGEQQEHYNLLLFLSDNPSIHPFYPPLSPPSFTQNDAAASGYFFFSKNHAAGGSIWTLSHMRWMHPPPLFSFFSDTKNTLYLIFFCTNKGCPVHYGNQAKRKGDREDETKKKNCDSTETDQGWKKKSRNFFLPPRQRHNVQPTPFLPDPFISSAAASKGSLSLSLSFHPNTVGGGGGRALLFVSPPQNRC